MTKEEILEKVKEREYDKRCVDASVCPTCGGNLSVEGDNRFLDKICKPCNLSFPYV